MKQKRLKNNNILDTLREQLPNLKKYNVKRIALFGSYAKGNQTKKSDIDLIVEFEKPGFDNYMDLIFYLENLFGKNVDILTPTGIKGIRIKKVAEDIDRSIIYV